MIFVPMVTNVGQCRTYVIFMKRNAFLFVCYGFQILSYGLLTNVKIKIYKSIIIHVASHGCENWSRALREQAAGKNIWK